PTLPLPRTTPISSPAATSSRRTRARGSGPPGARAGRRPGRGLVDTDLITGGDQPSPRADQNPSPSFGESIISTIVSSWPVFVLAASGMAAVGFIIYLMGRRGKQE